MAEFIYNNNNNANTNYMPFELNYDYHSDVFFKNKTDPHSKSHSTYELAQKLNNLILINC